MASAEKPSTAAAKSPGEVPGVRLSYVLGRLDRALRLQLDAALSPLEVTTPQFTTLSVLRRRDSLSNAQLARRSLIKPQSMFSVLRALERRGMIERTPAPDHKRILFTRLTADGLALLERCDEAVDEVERALLADFSEAEGSILLALATRGVRNLHAGLAGQEYGETSQSD